MGYSCYFRHPKTTQEMRLYYASTTNEEGVRINVRGRRKPKHLPNAWDDVWKPSSRNWKSYRKKQWRA